MSPRNCLSEAELSDFVLGKLPAAAIEEITGHVEECPDCQVTLASAAGQSDTVLSELRKLVPIEKFTQEPAYQQAIAKLGAGKGSSDGPAAALSPAAQGGPEGLVFGEYTVLEKIGAGGMGQVYKAEHRRMKRIVALKVLPRESMKSPDAVKRFHREVQAAARLEHPNIVTAHDAGESDGLHFLVMQFVDGQDLSSLSKKRGPLPVADVVNYIRQTACGLAYAHSKGIVHRDIKPGNLLLDREGVVKILDMGLARFDDGASALATAEEGLTHSGQVMGTADYMAPEQAFDTRSADARADVYSLGCTLYRLFMGKSLFTGESLMQKLLAHRESTIPNLCELRSDVPARLDAIFQKLVAKQPKDRYQTMNEVVADLDACRTAMFALPSATAKDEPSSASESRILTFPDETAYQSRKDSTIEHASANPSSIHVNNAQQPPNKRRGWLMAAAGGAAAAILAGVIIILQHPDGTQTKLEVPDGTKIILPGGDQQASGNKPTAATTVPTPLAATSASHSNAPSPFDVLKREDVAVEALTTAGLGNPAKAPPELVAVLSIGDKWRTSTEVLAYAPQSGTIISILGGRHGVRFWNVATRLTERTFNFPEDDVYVLAISPDGQCLATTGSSPTIKIWDLATRTEKLALKGHTQQVRSLAFSPDGKTLASGSGKDDDGPVRLWDVASGTAKHVLKGHTYHVYAAFSPDGQQLVTSSGDTGGGMHLWDVAAGRDLGTFHEQFNGSSTVAFSPNGKMIATGGLSGRVVVLDVATRKTIAVLLRPQRDRINSVAFNPDNKTLAVGGVNGAVHLWDIATAKEVKKLQIGPPDGSINNVAYDATGRYLLTGNGNASVAVLRLAPATPVSDATRPIPTTPGEQTPSARPESTD